jgi:hypothetical protein
VSHSSGAGAHTTRNSALSKFLFKNKTNEKSRLFTENLL